MKKAIIVGGSMAGMLAGNMLIRQGWVRSSYYCPKCRKPRTVEILGAMR